jgi:hypothetical protein
MLATIKHFLFVCIGTLVFTSVAICQMHSTRQLDEKSLFCNGKAAYLRAYDLSPDGQTLAIVTTPLALFNQSEADSCLAIWNIATQQIQQSVGVTVRQSLVGSGFSPQVLFVQGGKKVVLQNQDTIAVYKAEDLTQTHLINPPKGEFKTPLQVLYASESDQLFVAFGTPRKDHKYVDAWQNISEVVDVTSADVRGAWKLDDIPLSISPDGKWVALSDRANVSGYIGVMLFDVTSGQNVRLKDPQFGFKATGNILGRLIPQFLDNDKLLVGPNSDFVQNGRDSEAGIKIISVPQGAVLSEIKPKHFGSMGEFAVSGTHSSFATISQSIPASALTSHVRLPRSAKPNLIIIQLDGTSFKADTSTSLDGRLVLRDFRSFDPALLRLSSNGRVVSVLHDYGIKIYSTK